jgi:hypothetical protein
VKAPKYFFTLSRNESQHGTCYAHAVLAIYCLPTSDYHTGLHPIFSVQWQSDSDQTPARWYCPHAEVRTDFGCQLSVPEQLKTAARLLEKLGMPEGPSEVVTDLVAAGIDQRIYDGRLSQYLPPSEVQPPEIVAWYARVRGECCAKVLARNEEDAQEEAAREFGARISKGSHAAVEKFQAWLDQGRPVERSQWDHAPEVQPIATLLQPLGQAAPAPEAAQEMASAA